MTFESSRTSFLLSDSGRSQGGRPFSLNPVEQPKKSLSKGAVVTAATQSQRDLDRQVLTSLIALRLPPPEAAELAALLLDELKSLARVQAASTVTLDRLQVPPEVRELLSIFRQTMLASLRRDILNPLELSSWDALIDYLHVSMAGLEREQFRVLFLDGHNRLIAEEVMSEGTVNQTAVHIREVVKRALELNAIALILVHNHPSGKAVASRDDIRLTNQIRQSIATLGITLHDHVVVGLEGHQSLKGLGLL